MEWFFRRYFWIVQAVLLAVSAFLVAKTINIVVGYQLSKRLTVEHPVVRPKYRSVLPPIKDFARIDDRNLFDAKHENITWTALMQAHEGESDSWENAALSSQRLHLTGTAVFADPTLSLATIVDLSKGSEGVPSTYSINQCPSKSRYSDPVLREILEKLSAKSDVPCNRLPGGSVIRRIEQTRVYFYNENDRRYEYIALDEKDEVGPISSPRKFAADTGPSDDLSQIGESVQQIGPNSYEIEQGDLDDALSNLSQISTQARAVPAFKDGKPIGFKMVSIQPDSVFTKIGMKVGDIVTRINGYELNSPDKALEVYQKLRTAKQFNIDLERGDNVMTKNYSIVR